MSATPTARPWTAERSAVKDDAINIMGGGFFIATAWGGMDAPNPGNPTMGANARLIVTAVNHHAELVTTVRELRDACAAAMRVVADCDTMHLAGADAETRQQRFVDELHLAGVTDGFGKRADDLLARLDGAEREQGEQ